MNIRRGLKGWNFTGEIVILNTIKTTLGFISSVAKKYSPVKLGPESLEDTYNYRKITELVSTSGQPTEEQFCLIQQAGFKTVINLAPQGLIENTLKTQPSLLKDLGVEYIHIPVLFDNPTEDDFQQFTEAMQQRTDQKVWVHCAANARVSAFMYRYRRALLNEPESIIREDLDAIWEPFGVWKKFISEPSD